MRTRCNDDTPDGLSSSQRAKTPWQLWLMLVMAIVATTGCSGLIGIRPTVAGYAVEPVDYVPVAVNGYPRVIYNDQYTYLVDGRWYYPTNDGWVVFVDEPRPLAQYRARLQTAPPATRAPDVYYGYPPEQRQPIPPRQRQPARPQELQREYRPQ